MYAMPSNRFLAGLILLISLGAEIQAQSPGRPADDFVSPTMKAPQTGFSQVELLARADGRIETLRSKLFDLQMLELDLQIRLDDLDYRLSPEIVQWALAFVGSARPMDERRVALRNRLESEKQRVSKQLELLASAREKLNAALQEAESDRDRIRQRLNIEQ